MDHRLPVLVGRRVLLREPTAACGERLFASASDPEVARFLAFHLRLRSTRCWSSSRERSGGGRIADDGVDRHLYAILAPEWRAKDCASHG
jgi:hypothetical protein